MSKEPIYKWRATNKAGDSYDSTGGKPRFDEFGWIDWPNDAVISAARCLELPPCTITRLAPPRSRVPYARERKRLARIANKLARACGELAGFGVTRR